MNRPTLDEASVSEFMVELLPALGFPTRPINGSRGMLKLSVVVGWWERGDELSQEGILAWVKSRTSICVDVKVKVQSHGGAIPSSG